MTLLIPILIVMFGAGLYAIFQFRVLAFILAAMLYCWLAFGYNWWPFQSGYPQLYAAYQQVENHGRQWAKEDGVPYVSAYDHYLEQKKRERRAQEREIDARHEEWEEQQRKKEAEETKWMANQNKEIEQREQEQSRRLGLNRY